MVIDAIVSEEEYEIVGLIDSYRRIGDVTLNYRAMRSEEGVQCISAQLGVFITVIFVGDYYTSMGAMKRILKAVQT